MEAGRRRDRGKRRLSGELDDALIAELAARPDDVELVRVYADWLLQHEHPAGELVVTQLERIAHDSEALVNREYELYWDRVEPHMKAVLARDHVSEFEWRRGLLHCVTLHHHGGEEVLEETLRRLAADPCGWLVRRIEIHAVEFDGAGDLSPAIRELAALQFPRLAELAFREGANLGNPWIDGPIRVGDVTPLYAAYPRLEVFELGGKQYELGDLELPALKKLVLADMRPSDVATIARARLPALAELELYFGRWRVDGIDAVFRPLFDRSMPMLARLAIAAGVPQVMQYLTRVVPGAAISQHARILAFPRAALDDECVRALVQWAPRLRVLERLELDARGVSTEHRRTLEQTFGRLVALR